MELSRLWRRESRFNLSSEDNRVRVWRPRGERLNHAFALQRHTAPTADAMVWGAIAYNIRSSLVLIRDTMTSQWYVHDILQPYELPLMQRLSGAIFHQDNARPPTARVSQYCLRTITTHPRPAQSPDLSPIEHIWDHLRRGVGHPTSLNELEARQTAFNFFRPGVLINRRHFREGKGEGSTAIGKHFNLGESTVRAVKKIEAAIRKSVISGTKLSTKFASYTRDVLLERTYLQISQYPSQSDDGGFEVNFSIKSKSSNNWVISVIPDLYPVIKDHGYLYLNFERVRIETFISVMQCSTCGTLGHTRNHCSNTQACFSCSSTDDHDRTSCEPRCINCTNHNVRFRSGFSENHGCRDKHCPVLIQFKKRTMDHTDYGR
ncbi:transposable element Tcb2 transposase [Trichonephila clavipes]|nr:transposable element Tcb2 transposase [Trichonephila clavipes]